MIEVHEVDELDIEVIEMTMPVVAETNDEDKNVLIIADLNTLVSE